MTLCFFVSYNKDGNFQNDINYFNLLKRYFNKVVLVTNMLPKNFNDEHLIFNNEGYDFGFFYKAINSINTSEYTTIAFINNSNVLAKNRNFDKIFKWAKERQLDFWGLTDSIEAPPGIKLGSSYHIQSHFLVFEKNAIPHILKFFKEINFERFFTIKNESNLRQSIINECEIGITQYLKRNGLKIESYFKYNVLFDKYRKNKNLNMHVWLWEELILEGYPLIKKKILNNEWRFLKNINNHKKYI